VQKVGEMADHLTGRVAIVTGAAHGIGRASAIHLAELGCDIVIADADEGGARELADDIATNTAIWTGDLTEEDAASAVVRAAVTEFGRIDIVVSNAGYSRNALIEDMTESVFREMIDIHQVVPWRLLKAAAPHLTASAERVDADGHRCAAKVVTMASMSAYGSGHGQTNYGSAKAGLIGLTKALAREWGPRNICVNAVAPGVIDTRLTRVANPDTVAHIGGREVPYGLSEQTAQAMNMGVLLTAVGRSGTDQDVAGTVGFLCSPASDYITGQVLNVSGGMASCMSS